MDNSSKRENITLIGFIILSLANLSMLALRLMRGEFQFQDFHARWQECAYFLRGINPFDALNGIAIIPSIGSIDPDMVTVPWAWVWSVPINPGFLPFEAAKLWGIAVYVSLIAITSIMSYRFVRDEIALTSNKLPIAAALIVISQYCLVWSFLCGNHGALACLFIVLALFCYKKQPYLAAILMTFAMIKPQVAVPFFVTFLLIRQYKVVFTAVIAELLTLILITVTLHIDIFSLLRGTASVGTNLEGVFFGLFNMLKYSGVPTGIILIADMLIGIAFILVVTFTMMNTRGMEYRVLGKAMMPPIDLFWGASIASTFWFYKQSHDLVIIIIPCIILILKIARLDKGNMRFAVLQSIQFLIVAIFYIQSASRKIFCRIVPTMSEAMSKELFTTLTCIVMIVITIFIVIDEKKYER